MCKILTIKKKVKSKKIQIDKKLITQKLLSNDLTNSSFYELNYINKTNNTFESLFFEDGGKNGEEKDSNLSCKREKSRIAAKKRRNQENENLSELYISLPVATHSKLLSCNDSQFIGNFEKATIIKISAYILNLYNSISDVLFDSFHQFGTHQLVSLFSESIFGLFWCERTSKLVFSSPGLAKLTGLYWCNMIGMPRSSIIVENGNQHSSNMIFLRFMMGALKDRGIFTVNPQKTETCHQPDDIKSEKLPVVTNQAKRDFIGKLPCTVWCSEKLPNGISFNLIQPLIIKSQTLPERNKFKQSHHFYPYRLPPSNSFYQSDKICISHQFISYHYVDSLATISMSGDFCNSLGYTEETFSKSSLLSFFHFNDIVQVARHVNEILSGQKKIKMGVARFCTPNVDVYRWCRYILQVNSFKDISESNLRSFRSGTTQGESYSQNFVRMSNFLNDDQDNYEKLKDDVQNCWIEAAFTFCHYFKENQSEYALTFNQNLVRMNSDCEKTNSQKVSFVESGPHTYPEENAWFDLSSNSASFSTSPSIKQEAFTDENGIFYHSNGYEESKSILLKELMRPIKTYSV